MRERWRNVRRAPAGYRVSSLGRVRGPGGPLTPVPDRDGYLRIKIRGEQVAVAHLVLEAFDRPRPFGMECLHDPKRSEGRQDVRLSVLRWGTHLENEQDKKEADSGTLNGRRSYPPVPPVTAVTRDVQR